MQFVQCDHVSISVGQYCCVSGIWLQFKDSDSHVVNSIREMWGFSVAVCIFHASFTDFHSSQPTSPTTRPIPLFWAFNPAQTPWSRQRLASSLNLFSRHKPDLSLVTERWVMKHLASPVHTRASNWGIPKALDEQHQVSIVIHPAGIFLLVLPTWPLVFLPSSKFLSAVIPTCSWAPSTPTQTSNPGRRAWLIQYSLQHLHSTGILLQSPLSVFLSCSEPFSRQVERYLAGFTFHYCLSATM